MPEQYYENTDDALPYSIAEFFEWLQSGPFHHKLTGTIMGGPFGLKWAILLLARAHWSDQSARKGSCPEYQVRSLSVSESECISEAALWLVEQMQASVWTMQRLRTEGGESPDCGVPSMASFRRAGYWTHRVSSAFILHAHLTHDSGYAPDRRRD